MEEFLNRHIQAVAELFDRGDRDALVSSADDVVDRRLGSMIAIDTIAVENEVADNMYQRSELDYLIYNDPIGYADLILNGNPETYLKTVTEYYLLDS